MHDRGPNRWIVRYRSSEYELRACLLYDLHVCYVCIREGGGGRKLLCLCLLLPYFTPLPTFCSFLFVSQSNSELGLAKSEYERTLRPGVSLFHCASTTKPLLHDLCFLDSINMIVDDGDSP